MQLEETMVILRVTRANPFTTSSGSSTITVAHTSHGLAVDDRVIFSGSSAVNGVTPNDVEMTVASVVDANSYTVVLLIMLVVVVQEEEVQ